jgi:DNA replication protein DnaC
LSWAEHRRTKREEDHAYSLFGIFGVYLPIIYGEGKAHALKRLDKTIRKAEKKAERNFLVSLRFDQISARQTTIRDAHNQTCQWLLTKSEYIKWLDATMMAEHNGLLWIKGKPGTGKSTIMKFIYHHMRKEIERTAQPTNQASKSLEHGSIIAFFFNARGALIEKSTLGMYQSLLLQLLERRKSLRKVIGILPFSMTA